MTSYLYGNSISELAKDTGSRDKLSVYLKKDFEKHLPKLIEYLAETNSFLCPKGEEFTDLLKEAQTAYGAGYWRSVIALIGVASESFTDKLYIMIDKITSVNKIDLTRNELFGKDENVRENNKLAVLLLCGKIEKPIFTKLSRIKKLRDSYVHPQKEHHNRHSEAKEVLNSFIDVMNWHVSKQFPTYSPELKITIQEAE